MNCQYLLKKQRNIRKLIKNFQSYVLDEDYIAALRRYKQNSYNLGQILPVLDRFYADERWASIKTSDYYIADDVFGYHTGTTNQIAELQRTQKELLQIIDEHRNELDGFRQLLLVESYNTLPDGRKKILRIINAVFFKIVQIDR